jgi:hypothetical protein
MNKSAATAGTSSATFLHATAMHHDLPAKIACGIGLVLPMTTGAANGAHANSKPQSLNPSFTQLVNKMTKFFFHFPLINQLATFRAVSELDARHQLINSPLAPYYGQAVLLGTDDGR